MQIGAVLLQMWIIECSGLAWFRKQKEDCQFVDFIARWRHLCYKFHVYRVIRCVHNKMALWYANSCSLVQAL